MQSLIDIIPELINKFPDIDVLYLFGSHANGTSTAASDIDIAVFVTDAAVRANPLLDLEIEGIVEKKLHRSVDVIIMQRVSPILQHQVIATGRRLFESDPKRRARLESLAFKRFLDIRHYQKRRQEAFADG